MDNLVPLKITASLVTRLAVLDNYSPSLEGILSHRTLERYSTDLFNLVQNADTAKLISETLAKYSPLGYREVANKKVSLCSAPFYSYSSEEKREISYNRVYKDSWGKKKDTTKTRSKPSLALRLRNPKQITWYVTGDRPKIMELLTEVKYLGKKRSKGNGVVIDWQIEETKQDWSWKRGKYLTACLPYQVVTYLCINPDNCGPTVKVNWKSPTWLEDNQGLCYTPYDNVRQLSAMEVA